MQGREELFKRERTQRTGSGLDWSEEFRRCGRLSVLKNGQQTMFRLRKRNMWVPHGNVWHLPRFLLPVLLLLPHSRTLQASHN